MQSNYISQAISVLIDGYKTVKGDQLAPFTMLGHAAKGIERYGNASAWRSESVKNFTDSFQKAAEESEFVRSAKEMIDFTKKTDEIGMCKSAVSVFFSSSPIRKGIEEICNWTTKLFTKDILLNKLPKLIKNQKTLNSISDSVAKFSKNTKGFGQLPVIISGVTYSAATILLPKYGKKLGTWVCDKLGVKPYSEDEKQA